MEDPVYYWDPVIAPSGLAFYTGDLFPQWKNSLFVGGLRGMMLVRLEMRNDKVVAEEPLLTDLKARIRDVRVGPDGAVYVLTDSGTPRREPEDTADEQAAEAHAEVAARLFLVPIFHLVPRPGRPATCLATRRAVAPDG